MILQHIYQHAKLTNTPEYEWSNILAFFMPWFFYKAGMFFKEKPIKKIIISSTERLLIPFMVFSIIGEFVLFISNAINSPKPIYFTILYSIGRAIKNILLEGSSPGNLALWFLLSLFCVRIIWAFCYEKNRLYIIPFLCLIAPLMHFVDIKYPFYLANISSGLTYFGFGFILKDFKINNPYVIITLTALWISSIIYFPNMIDMRGNSLNSGYYILSFPQNLLGILAINSLFEKLQIKCNILSNIGKNSMGYYCIHWIILITTRIFFKGYTYLIITIFCCLIFLPLSIYIISQTKLKKLIA